MEICIDLTIIVRDRINQVYLNRVAYEMLEMSKRINDMKAEGCTIGYIRDILAVDRHTESIFNLSLCKSRGEFERLVRANEMCGYVVDNNDNIHCISSSSWIAQFDGCKEWEIEPCYMG